MHWGRMGMVVVVVASALAIGGGPASADGCDRGDRGYRLVSASGERGFSADGQSSCASVLDYGSPPVPVAGIANDPRGLGSLMVRVNGNVVNLTERNAHHGPGAPLYTQPSAAPFVGIAMTRRGNGYWTVTATGEVFAYGHAAYLGGLTSMRLGAPIVDAASPSRGTGYWLVGADGGVFTFGDARFYGSLGKVHLRAPIVDLVPTRSNRGYWLVAADGGVFAFGDARYYGGAATLHLHAPIVGMALTRTGRGYWLAAADAGVFAFGDARYLGGAELDGPGTPVAGIVT